jgi:hypothetical protein
MLSQTPYEPLNWKIRLVMLAVAIVLSSSVIFTWRAGVVFAKAMEQVEHLQAISDAEKIATARRAAEGFSEPGVVTIGIFASPAKSPAK